LVDIGYIPRSQEHFGRAFVETTNASLSNFKKMLKNKNQLSPRVEACLEQRQRNLQQQAPQQPRFPAVVPSQNESHDDPSPYKLPADHPHKTFISGYTGFVPRLQNHFGEVH
jgi:hypothetical protein